MELQEKFEWAHRALSFYDYEQAEKLAWEIREERPDLAAVYLLLGNIYTNTQRHQEGINAYQRAVELDADSVEGYNNLGIAYRKTDAAEKALSAFQKAHDRAPERADIAYNLANCYKQLHDDGNAVRYYEEAIRLDPQFLMAYNNLGTLYQHRGSTRKAIELFEQGLGYDQNHPTLHYNLGIAEESLGNIDKAVKEYRRSLKSKPGWTSALNNLGVALQKTDHLKEAEQTFRDLLKVEPNNIQAYNNIGVLLAAQQKYNEAEEYFQKSLSIKPAYQNAIVNLGKLYVESGEGKKAQEKLQSILHTDPDNTDVRYQLALLLLKNGKANAALHEALHLVHTDHNNPDYLYLLGKTRHRLGSHPKALPPLEKACKIRESFEAALIELAYTLADMGKYDDAAGRIRMFLEKNPNSLNAAITHAEIKLEAQNLDDALSEFQELNRTYPKNERILKGLLSAFQKLGNREEALRISEELVHLYGNPELSEDFDKLEAGLQMYEQIMSELATEQQSSWQENLRQLLQTDEQENTSDAGGYIQETDLESDEDIQGETVPIIDVGGIEPVIAVNEQDGDPISLIDMEEDIEPPEEAPEEEEEEKLSGAFSIEGDRGRNSGSDGGNRNQWNQPYPDQQGPEPQYPQSRMPVQQNIPPSPAPPPPSGYQQPPTVQQPAVPQYIPYPVYQQAPPSGFHNQPGSPTPPARPTPDVQPTEPRPSELPPSEEPAPPDEMSADEAADKAEATDETAEEIVGDSAFPEDSLFPQDIETLEDAVGENGIEGEEQDEIKLDSSSTQGLFDYLAELIEYLPEEERTHYENSDMRLRVEALRARLRGRKGLHAMASQLQEKSASMQREPMKPDSVSAALSYLHNLSEDLPNPAIGFALKQKMHDIIRKLQD